MRRSYLVLLLVLLPLLGAPTCGSGSPIQTSKLTIEIVGEGTVVIENVVDSCTYAESPCELDLTSLTSRLTAQPAPSWRFDHWENESCIAGADPRSPTITAALSRLSPQLCRAVFVRTSFGDWWAVSFESPMPRSFHYAVYIPLYGRIVLFGEQGAAMSGDVVDGTMTAIESPSTKPGGDRAVPMSASERTLPGVNPYTGVALADGALVVAGRKYGTGGGAWLGRFTPGDALEWQVTLGGDARQIMESVADGTGGVWVYGVRVTTSFVASISANGTVNAVTGVATNGFPADIVTLGAGYAIASSTFLNPGRDSDVIVADAGGAVRWQKHVSGGFAEVAGLVATADGGLVVIGRHGTTGSSSLAWLARFAADGTLQWQKTYAAIGIRTLLETTTGFRVIGGATSGMLVMDLDANGAVLDARAFADGGTTGPGAMTAFATADGGLALVGANASTGRITAMKVSVELAITDCADASLGTDVDLATITVADGTATITDGTVVLSSLPAYTPAPTTVAPTSSAPAATNLCTN